MSNIIYATDFFYPEFAKSMFKYMGAWHEMALTSGYLQPWRFNKRSDMARLSEIHLTGGNLVFDQSTRGI